MNSQDCAKNSKNEVRASALRETKKYAQRMQQKKKLANIMIPEEIEKRNWKMMRTQLGKVAGSVSPINKSPRKPDKKCKKRSYVNQQLSNDIKRTQDRLNRLLQPARSRKPLFSPLAKGFSIESGFSKENSSRVSSISKRKGQPGMHTKGVGSVQDMPLRSVSLTPPTHSYTHSDSSFQCFHHQKKSPLMGPASPSISPVSQQNAKNHYFQPTYASRQKQVTPPLISGTWKPNKPKPTVYSQRMSQNFRGGEMGEKRALQALTPPLGHARCSELRSSQICEGVDEGDELIEEGCFIDERESPQRGGWEEMPPPVEPFLSEQFSEDELNFYPSVAEPADNKLVKIKQIFSKFKKENDRISSDYSRCSGSASLRDSVAYTYISKAPSQTSLQNTRRLFNEVTQKSLFQKQQQNRPSVTSQKATIAGMARKKKAMSVVTGPTPSPHPFGVTGVLSIPKFLSISLQENAAALSFQSERQPKELQTGLLSQNMFHSPTFSHKATNTSIREQEEYKEQEEGDAVEDYVEKKKQSARILGGAVNSVLGKQVLRAFDSLRYFNPKESRVLYSCAVGLSYLLSSKLYRRLIEREGRVMKEFLQRWKREPEQPTCHQEEDELTPPSLQLRSNLFGFVEETAQMDEQSPVFRGEPGGFGSFRD